MGNRAATPETIGGKVAEVICVRSSSSEIRNAIEGHLAHKMGNFRFTLFLLIRTAFFLPAKLPLTVVDLGNKPLGVFSQTISGLQSGTAYKYRFLMKNGAGVGFSHSVPFLLLEFQLWGIQELHLYQLIPADLLVDLPSVGGDDANVTFFWGNNDGGQNPSSWDSNLTLPGERANGPLSISVSSLQPGTVYYFSVRASNLAGSSWAQTFSFSTNSNNPPSQLNHSGSLQILENQPVGTIIGQFSASDPDLNSTPFFLFI